LQIFQYVFAAQLLWHHRMTPGFELPTIIVQRENPLAHRQSNHVEPIRIDFKGSVKLIDAAFALNPEMLLHVDRRAQSRRRQLQSQARALRPWQGACKNAREPEIECKAPDYSW
jgi:hypothetical protein